MCEIEDLKVLSESLSSSNPSERGIYKALYKTLVNLILGMAGTHSKNCGHFCGASGDTMQHTGNKKYKRSCSNHLSQISKHINSRIILVTVFTYMHTRQTQMTINRSLHKELLTAISNISSGEMFIVPCENRKK